MDPMIIKHYEDYNDVYYTGSLGKFEKWTHQLLEKQDVNSLDSIVVDIGGGDGQHVSYLNGNFDRYYILDVIDNSKKLNRSVGKENLNKIDFVLGNAEKLPFGDDTVDRIILTCILHHVDSPKKVLSECRRVLRNGGTISIYLPNDPGFLYRIIRHFAAHLKYARKTKRPMSVIKYLWAVEHKNHVLGLSIIIKNVFKNDAIIHRSYPFHFGSWNLNIFQIFQIEISKDLND
jgi:ubiquinone/menaquinone biosynthesis C-methylase UbiE